MTMSRAALNSITNNLQENRERLSQEAQQEKQNKIEQQKIAIQQQQQQTYRIATIGSLCLGGALVLVVAIFLFIKLFRKSKDRN